MAGLNSEKAFGGLLSRKKITIDRNALRDAGVGVLIKDERWNRLFSFIEKTPSIVKSEKIIKSLLEEKTRLHMENNMINAERAILVDNETRLLEIDNRVNQIEARTAAIDNEVGNANIKMLEEAASRLYRYMQKSQARISELETKISTARESLKEMISEREALNAAAGETYQFLHGLLGVSQIDSIDEKWT